MIGKQNRLCRGVRRRTSFPAMTAPPMDINGGGADLTAKYQVFLQTCQIIRQLRKQLSIHCCCECSVQPNPCSQKLATEYAKLRAQSAVLKKGLLEEQERSQSLQDQVFILKKKNIFKYLLRLTKERHHYEKEKERWKPCCSGLTFHRMQS